MTDTPTVSELLPAKARQWIYALLVAANGGYLVAEAAYAVPVPVLITIGVINAAGFSMATAKTEAKAQADAGRIDVFDLLIVVAVVIVCLFVWSRI